MHLIENLFHISSESFKKIPGCPVAYWVSESVVQTFNFPKIDDYGKTNNGFTTGNNDLFLRYWYECTFPDICLEARTYEDALVSKKKWFPYNKGGGFRKWYGNNDFVINWFNDGEEIKAFGHLVPRSLGFQFRKSITWSKISSSIASFRFKPYGTMFDVAGLSLFPNESKYFYYLLGLCNSCFACKCLAFLSPTLNYETGHIASLPVNISNEYHNEVDTLVTSNITLSKSDWDSFETSWDFERHPLARGGFSRVSEAFGAWERECEERFARLKANEEELNRIFIDIYGLQDELTPEVEEKDVTVRRADLSRDIRSLVSYAVGCMFGRYSLDTPGLAYAGGDWDPGRYVTFPADKDGILPICDDEYFHDDIVNLFAEFVKTVYGESTLEENLRFIADALGSKGSSPREMIRNYFLNSFYADHLKIYQKRPIYWLFDSGKKNGFKCLVYLHRYSKDTIARIRTDYVHEQQSRYQTAMSDLEHRLRSVSTSERVRLSKQLANLQAQADEVRIYEEKIHHLADQMIPLDLDDGVKVNYAKLGEVLAVRR